MTIKESLLESGNTVEEAQAYLDDMVKSFLAGTNPFQILDDCGLEEDYLEDLLNACEAYEGGQE